MLSTPRTPRIAKALQIVTIPILLVRSKIRHPKPYISSILLSPTSSREHAIYQIQNETQAVVEKRGGREFELERPGKMARGFDDGSG
jgi:hypothetical protein